MSLLEHFLRTLPLFLSVLLTFGLVRAGSWQAIGFFFTIWGLKEEARFFARVGILLFICLEIVLILLDPLLQKETHKDLFQLLALLLTAVIALSSTTFVSNAMTGFMLRGIQSFRLGDFLHVKSDLAE